MYDYCYSNLGAIYANGLCPRPGLEQGLLAPESSVLTRRPPRLLSERLGELEILWEKELTVKCFHSFFKFSPYHVSIKQ